jgi:hypothetical protein
MKAGEFGRANATALLRKCIRLGDIEYIVEDCLAKSNDLLSQAELLAEKVRTKKEKAKTAKQIKVLVMKRIQYKPDQVFKRKESWKGRSKQLFEGFGKDKLAMQVGGRDRASSRGAGRGPQNMVIPKEFKNVSGEHKQTLDSIKLEDEEEYDMGDKHGTSKNLSTMSLGSGLGGLGNI